MHNCSDQPTRCSTFITSKIIPNNSELNEKWNNIKESMDKIEEQYNVEKMIKNCTKEPLSAEQGYAVFGSGDLKLELDKQSYPINSVAIEKELNCTQYQNEKCECESDKVMPKMKLDIKEQTVDCDSIEAWEKFNVHMKKYIKSTFGKYDTGNFSLAQNIADEKTMLFNIIKYALRNHNNKGKDGDISKIVHYACMLFTKYGKK